MGSFGFATARAAIEQGLIPTTISSDLHTYSAAYPVVDLLTTMSKFVHLGMSLSDVVARTTFAPAAVLGQAGRIGTLQTGAEADIAVVNELNGEFKLWDCYKNSLTANRLLTPSMTIRAGRVF